MKRPAPALYNDLKEVGLFGTWENSRTKLSIQCTGGFDFVEMKNGEEYNKDSGGDISALDKVNKQITVTSIFGDSYYGYNIISKNKLSLVVGKRAGVVGGLLKVVETVTFSPESSKQYLTRKTKLDCDNAPQTLGDVFNQMRDQMNKGNYKQVGDTIVIEDPNAKKVDSN